MEQSLLNSMQWRLVGPFRGGRAPAVVGHPTERATFFFGACAGGVWKTTDGGSYWENVSDGYFNTASVGAIAVADADPNVIYVGMGETRFAATSPTATASTGRPTAARPGGTWG